MAATTKDGATKMVYPTPLYDGHTLLEPDSEFLELTLENVLFINDTVQELHEVSHMFSTKSIKNDAKGIKQFLKEIIRRSDCDRASIRLAVRYCRNIYGSFGSRTGNTGTLEFSHCVKRVFLSCLIITHKFINDSSFSMSSWSLISGLSKKDLSSMERWCLIKLDYNLYVPLETVSNPTVTKKRARSSSHEEQYAVKKLYA